MKPQVATICAECGAAMAAAALACPMCRRLVHATRLREIQTNATVAADRGDFSEALRLWREALELIPPDTRQYEIITGKVRELSSRVDINVSPAQGHRSSSTWKKTAGLLGAAGLILWKLKALVLVALTKGKLLLLGLTKLSTLSTMLLSLGAYWTQYGWLFALGLVLSIYVHEMGHVYALRRFGISASAPTFIPFIGAFVRMNQRPANAVEDARVGLAGPIWGAMATLVLFTIWASTAIPVIGAIAHFSAWLNLFNLIPVWQLDGARGIHALDQRQRGTLVGIMVLAWVLTHEGFLVALAAVTGFRLFTRDSASEGGRRTMLEFAGLILVLSILLAIPVPPRP